MIHQDKIMVNLIFGDEPIKITKADIKNLEAADYVHGHKNIEDDYYKSMKAKLREREKDANNFNDMKYEDYKRDDTAGYGIFDKLGYQFNDRLALDVDNDDIAKKFDKLMRERDTKNILQAPKIIANSR